MITTLPELLNHYGFWKRPLTAEERMRLFYHGDLSVLRSAERVWTKASGDSVAAEATP